jgi:hypothetical protein
MKIISPPGTGTTKHDLLDGNVDQDTVAKPAVEGSLILGNATPKWDTLGIGANKDVLTSNGTTASWQPPSGGAALLNGMVEAAGNNIIVAGAYAQLPTNRMILNLPAAGTYIIFYTLAAAAQPPGGALYVEFRNTTDAADITATQQQLSPGSSGYVVAPMNSTTLLTILAAKTLEIYAYQAGVNSALYDQAGLRSTAGWVKIA